MNIIPGYFKHLSYTCLASTEESPMPGAKIFYVSQILSDYSCIISLDTISLYIITEKNEFDDGTKDRPE